MSETEIKNGLSVDFRQAEPIPLNVRFSCAGNEFLALVGASGSGKTTVLRAIAGLVRPTSGSISCGSTVWFSSAERVFVTPQHRRVGLVFQDYALFPHLTAVENVAIARDGHSHPDARLFLERVNLRGLEARRPAELSGGQRQRVALARALAREPSVLLLDEPFSAVDHMTRERLKRELAILRGGLNIPIVCVTHDINEAQSLADRMTVIHHGTTLVTGTPQDVRLRPPSPLVARLMGHTNLFQAEVRQGSTAAEQGRIRWLERDLDVTKTGRWQAGEKVCWLIPSEKIIVQRQGLPSQNKAENIVIGLVTEVAQLGEHAAVTFSAKGHPNMVLNFKVAAHTLRHGELRPGAEAAVSLLADGIHLMPYQDDYGETDLGPAQAGVAIRDSGLE